MLISPFAASSSSPFVDAVKKAVKKGTLLGIQVMQVTYIPKDYLRTYVKARLENMRVPLCRQQMEFIDRLTEVTEDTKVNKAAGGTAAPK